ncbi:MAG: DUF1846 family protein [Clostridia bacterium]|nr:DUF1846 family protein [Clostridia bacterium]
MTPFNNEKYKSLQKEAILNRIKSFGKLYMEVGGKLFEDNHAARVLPGFQPDVKMQILRELKNELEVIFCVNANDIILKKVRADNGLEYGDEAIRLAQNMQNEKIAVAGIMITFYTENELVFEFEKKCKQNKIKTYKSFSIENYPHDLRKITSKFGFGKNDYVETHKNLILVSAPGPSSGKLQTCLSQLYHEKQLGNRAGYAKYETFPVWNLPLNSLVNIAYEMATVELGDTNKIDPFYKQKYHKNAVNYNRDIEAFPIVSKLLNAINGKEIYSSPTEMGINCVAFAIDDKKGVNEAAMQEISRRHEKHRQKFINGIFNKKAWLNSEKTFNKALKIYKK